jgi:hypothetical protein
MLIFSASYARVFSLVIVVRQKRSKSAALKKAHNYLRRAVPCCKRNKDMGSLVIGKVLKKVVSARYKLVSIYVSGGKERQINLIPHTNLSVLHRRPVD